MTHPGPEAAIMWLKQVADATPEADGLWTTRMIEGHHTVARARVPPLGSVCLCTNCGNPGVFRLGGPRAAETRTVWPAPDGAGGTYCRRCFAGEPDTQKEPSA